MRKTTLPRKPAPETVNGVTYYPTLGPEGYTWSPERPMCPCGAIPADRAHAAWDTGEHRCYGPTNEDK